LNDRELFHIALKAFGAVGSTSDQLEAVMTLRSYLKGRKDELSNKLRVENAQATKDNRLKPGDQSYGAHMRHCYGLNYDFHDGPGKPTERYACKYGEDDICPAALFEDPWAEYVRAEEAGEL
jgi:hypothetical protein